MLKITEARSIGRTLKAGIASKKALKEARRTAMSAAIGDAIGAGKDSAPLLKSTWRGFTQTALLNTFKRIMETDVDEFTPGWNYNADSNGPLSGSAPFYVSVKDGTPVLSGSARAEWIAARNIIDAIAVNDEVDFDQAIRQWQELPEAEQFKSAPIEPKRSKYKACQPLVKALFDLAMEKGLTVKELSAIIKGATVAVEKVKKGRKAA